MRLMARVLVLTAVLPLLGAATPRTGAAPQSDADATALRATALDYIEGWFTGDAERMARALHPELVKRIVVTDETTGRDSIDGMGASRLVEATRHGFGKDVPIEQRRTEVTILDVTGNAATLKIDAGPWVDYLHLVRVNGDWKILNVLWELR